jgi:hypothetical protein
MPERPPNAGDRRNGRDGRRRPGLAAAESLPCCYPRLESQGVLPKSARRRSVRDRGVEGSNPFAPTNFLTQFRPGFRACLLYDVPGARRTVT